MQMVGEKQISGMRSYCRYVHGFDSSDVVHLIHIFIDIVLTLTSMHLGVVYKSDTCVTAEMKAALKAAAAVLEDVDDSKKDWHPHSDEKVLDLVHPSLFPLLYGRSTVLSESEGTVPLRDCDAYIGKVRNSFGVTSPS